MQKSVIPKCVMSDFCKLGHILCIRMYVASRNNMFSAVCSNNLLSLLTNASRIFKVS